MGKGAGRKTSFQALFCKTEPPAPYSKMGVMASPFPSFKYRQVYRNHRTKQEGFGFVAQKLGGTDLHRHDSLPKNTCVSPLTVQGAQGDQLDVDVYCGDV